MDIKEKVRLLPSTPGVYIMKDDKGAVLYVGKAGNIRKRVSSYFYPSRRLPGRIEIMASKVADIAIMMTATEAEALIYENSLIKQLKPKYNVALRDDKSYPRLKITMGEKFPRLLITRQKADDGSAYFGPYSDAKLLRQAVTALRLLFPLRTCNKMPKNVCLNYHIRQCAGPCAGHIDEAQYAEVVAELKLFLEGRKAELIKRLTRLMVEESGRENFEEAGKIKARIEALASIKEKGLRYAPSLEVEELGRVLGLGKPPETIEAFDVSNIMGQEAVGSMITFYKGRPKKDAYRKFRIRETEGVDDYSMMREIVRRRYTRVVEEKGALPDLVVIDGGKGHLSAALAELENLALAALPAIGLAKEFEHIYMKGAKDPLVLPKDSKALHILERIRDEAHRFAITYHKTLRSKKVGASELDEIPGIGRRRKKALITYFGSVEKIKAAGIDDLLKVEGIDERSAKNIIDHFRG